MPFTGWKPAERNRLRKKIDFTKFCDSSKVQKILEDSLDSIPSPSMKIQIICGKVYLR